MMVGDDFPDMSRSTTLAVANQKGGVAKTTSVASLGAALAELGHSVLLVDLDPQACLTFSLGIDPEDIEISVHHVLTKGTHVSEVIIETDDGVDLLPATIELARAEADLLTRTGREQVLKAALADLADEVQYDWVPGPETFASPCSRKFGTPPDRIGSAPGRKFSGPLELHHVAVRIADIEGRPHPFCAVSLAHIAGLDAGRRELRAQRGRVERPELQREMVHVPR